MRNLGRLKFIAVGLALFCASTLSADSLMLTSAPTGIIGPYVATINGTPGIELICVSYYNTTYLGTTYTYNPTSFTTFNNASTPESGSPGTWYQIAWLANQLFDATPNSDAQKALQWAIWKATDSPNDPGPVPVPTALSAAVNTLITSAQSQTWTAGQFDNFRVYTPANYVQGITGPQQFIVRTPEASVVATWALMLFAFGNIVVFLKRRSGLAVLA